MPALVLFRRKWLISDDLLLFPFFGEVIFRTIFALMDAYMIWLHFKFQDNCLDSKYIMYFLYVTLADLLLNIPLCGLLTWVSAQGAIMQVKKRKLLPKMLYVKIATFFFDLLLVIFGGYLVFPQDLASCIHPDVNTFVQALVFTILSYFAIIIICVVLSYNSLGSPKFWNQAENVENCPEKSAKSLKKAEKTWAVRLRYMCCWLGFNKNKHSIYKEIATFLASFLKNTDLVPSDIFAGLLILNKIHAAERRKLKFMDSLCSHGYISSTDDSHPSWMTIENALYFLRLAKSTYGWPILLDSCNPCVLASQTRCCGLWSRPAGSDWTDDCCQCNIVAVQKATGFENGDLIYVSYKNTIYEPAFFVAIDKSKSAIVIGIRGTLSLSDLVTDIDAGSERILLENSHNECFCHRGTLRSAKYILKKLRDLNILKLAFAEYPDFVLVITGHSLGASISSVLGLLLRVEYPKVQCYAYGPLAVLSSCGAKLTQDFTLSVAVGDDMAPRLCVTTCEKLRLEIMKSLEECEVEKYKLLLNAFSRFLFKKKLFRALSFPKSVNTFRQNSVQSVEENSCDISISKDFHLYAPGRILYLEKTSDGYRALWKTGFHFHRLIVSPRMFADHHPRKMQKFLQEVRDKSSQKCAAEINLAYSPTPELDRKQRPPFLDPIFIV